jgi:hypothetical protein
LVTVTLHILDVALARGFEFDGRVYERVNLTNLRSVPLGDRWDGEISIAKNTIEIVIGGRVASPGRSLALQGDF